MFTNNIGKYVSRWVQPLERKDYLNFYRERWEEDNAGTNLACMVPYGFEIDPSALPHGRVLTFDIECYINYFLITFHDPLTGEFWEFEKFNDSTGMNLGAVLLIMTHNTLISFNGIGYDMPMTTPAILDNATNAEMKFISDDIIVRKKKHKSAIVSDHIDIAPVCPLTAAMKMYGARSGFKALQELPLPPDTVLTFEQKEEIRKYCRKDVQLTWHLYKQVEEQIELRKELSAKYDIDMRSMSDPQIAEAIIAQYLSKQGVKPKKRTKKVLPFAYRVPEWVSFETKEFQAALDNVKKARFVVDKDGYAVLPTELSEAFMFVNGRTYQFGIGGLHSQEENCITIAAEDEMFGEFDVGSMYPSIIIEQGLFPFHLSPVFLAVYSGIKDERMEAKGVDPTKAQTYKIVLNGSYGKFGSKYSFLYSPELLIQTTITGQLSLLMLIERMHLAGGDVVSANTDGVNVKFKKDNADRIFAVQKWWEETTSYMLEFTQYDATFNRDVNNYIAIKTKGGIKGKGTYGEPSLSKNPQTPIVNTAIIELLSNGTPMEETIRACNDPFMFTSCQKVGGGCNKDGEQIGELVRWYYSTSTETAIQCSSRNGKVPKTDGALPALDLPEGLWDDLDFDWYLKEADAKLKILFFGEHKGSPMPPTKAEWEAIKDQPFAFALAS